MILDFDPKVMGSNPNKDFICKFRFRKHSLYIHLDTLKINIILEKKTNNCSPGTTDQECDTSCWNVILIVPKYKLLIQSVMTL